MPAKRKGPRRPKAGPPRPGPSGPWRNRLFYGDNLEILRDCIPDESVDLIYLDPPFNSKATYSVLFREPNGSGSPAQIRAFMDSWHWGPAAEAAFTEIVDRAPGQVVDVVKHLRGFLGANDMMAYLVMMAIRLVELRRVLAPTGSIYLHCDPKASHYLKVVMDAVFGARNFQNEFIWYYSGGGASKRRWARKHDVILFYTAGPEWTFNADDVRVPYKWVDGQPRADGSERDLEAGKLADDVWAHHGIMPWSSERLGYPTQKPLALLERIVRASSSKGDVVLDPFCGCGTAVVAAQRLGRRWIGIDITHLAIALVKKRLHDMFDERAEFKVEGEPVDLPGAQELARNNRYQFEYWAVSLVDGQPKESGRRKGADRGVDGVRFFLDAGQEVKKVVIQVKSGRVGVKDVREMRTVLRNAGAEVGLFVTLMNPTRQMQAEAASAGVYRSTAWGRSYPRVQLLTVADLLNRRQPELPPSAGSDVTFKRAKTSEVDDFEQTGLGGGAEAD
jgi:site-specific DNA-methyltransferase (adenine-specific)